MKRNPSYFLSRFHRKQEDAWLNFKAGKNLVLDWGRRSGKSELVAEILIEDIETYGVDCMYVAKTQVQARKILWPKLKKRLVGNPQWKLNESRLEAKFIPREAVISLKGADKEKDDLRGDAHRIIALDEFAFWRNPEVVGEIFVPMLADHDGQFIFVSTYKGKNHFFDLVERGKRDSRYFNSHATMFDNPFISETGRNAIVSEYEGGQDNLLYKQEILAIPVVFEGLVFPFEPSTYTEPRWEIGMLKSVGTVHFRGLDFGYRDDTACLWLAYNKYSEKWHFYDDYKQNALLIKDHVDQVNPRWPTFKYRGSWADTQTQLIEEWNALSPQDLHFSSALKRTKEVDRDGRILKMVEMLRSKRLTIATECTNLLKEMLTFEWEQESNDHCIDAASYVLFNAPEPMEPEVTSRGPVQFLSESDQSFGEDDYFINAY